MYRYEDYDSDSSFSDSSTDERRAAQKKQGNQRKAASTTENEESAPPISLRVHENGAVTSKGTGPFQQVLDSISTLEERLFMNVRLKNGDLFESMDGKHQNVDRPMDGKASRKASSLLDHMRRKALSVCIYQEQEMLMHKLREGASELGFWDNKLQRQILQGAFKAIHELPRYRTKETSTI